MMSIYILYLVCERPMYVDPIYTRHKISTDVLHKEHI